MYNNIYKNYKKDLEIKIKKKILLRFINHCLSQLYLLKSNFTIL